MLLKYFLCFLLIDAVLSDEDNLRFFKKLGDFSEYSLRKWVNFGFFRSIVSQNQWISPLLKFCNLNSLEFPFKCSYHAPSNLIRFRKNSLIQYSSDFFFPGIVDNEKGRSFVKTYYASQDIKVRFLNTLISLQKPNFYLFYDEEYLSTQKGRGLRMLKVEVAYWKISFDWFFSI